MSILLKLSSAIDNLLGVIAKIGGWFAVLLMFLVVYDVVVRYLGVPRLFGINATQLQESQYWAHTILFSLVIGYAYTRQAHVRIDLVRDRLPMHSKYIIEIIGCLMFLVPYCLVAIYFTTDYAHRSFQEGEVSKSMIGFTNIWVLKSFIPLMYVLLGLAGLSQLIKSIAGLNGQLPDQMVRETIGGDA